jgi:adenosylhomocysteine nucleosidase
VAGTREEKQALARAGALAVDMESAAVRAVAGERGLRYYCIKAVSDRADEALPLDFNRYRNPDGRFSRIHIGFAALARPVLFPRLMALQRKAGQAAQSLGDFLANCEF